MSKHEELVEQVKELIRKNKTAKALELLSNEQLSSLDKQLIILSGQFSKIKEDQILGVIDDDVAQRRINVVNSRILELSDLIGSSLGKSGTNGQALDNSGLVGSSKSLLLIAGAIALILLTFFGIRSYNNTQAAERVRIAEEAAQDSIRLAEKLERFKIDSIAAVKAQEKIDSLHRAMVYQDSMAEVFRLEQEFLKAQIAQARADSLKLAEKAARDKAAKEKAARDKAAKEKAARDKEEEERKRVNASREIKITMLKLYCEVSDDEGPGNDADMDRFKFTATATQSGCRAGGEDRSLTGNGLIIYEYKGGEVVTPKGHTWMDRNKSAVFAYDNGHCTTLRLSIGGYAREQDNGSSSADEEATGTLVLNNPKTMFGKHTFRLKSSDFTYRCDFRVEKVGQWEMGGK